MSCMNEGSQLKNKCEQVPPNWKKMLFFFPFHTDSYLIQYINIILMWLGKVKGHVRVQISVSPSVNSMHLTLQGSVFCNFIYLGP